VLFESRVHSHGSREVAQDAAALFGVLVVFVPVCAADVAVGHEAKPLLAGTMRFQFCAGRVFVAAFLLK